MEHRRVQNICVQKYSWLKNIFPNKSVNEAKCVSAYAWFFIFIFILCFLLLLYFRYSQKYILDLDTSGELIYRGDFTSFIVWIEEEEIWLLRDTKDPKARVTSSALYRSLLLGEHIFDFSGVKVRKDKKDKRL